MGAALEAPSPLRQPRRGGEKADPYSALKRKGYLGTNPHRPLRMQWSWCLVASLEPWLTVVRQRSRRVLLLDCEQQG
jgi:hypothetical protein